MKQLAAKGDVKSARILAKEVVRSNKQKDRLHVSKARLGSIGVQLQHQLCELWGLQVCFAQMSKLGVSDGQSYGLFTKIDGNYEAQ